MQSKRIMIFLRMCKKTRPQFNTGLNITMIEGKGLLGQKEDYGTFKVSIAGEIESLKMDENNVYIY